MRSHLVMISLTALLLVVTATAVAADRSSEQTNMAEIRVTTNPGAWQISTGDQSVVAIISSGVKSNHPDLAANIWSNPYETAGDGKDNDGNGFTDDVAGWNFVGGGLGSTATNDGYGSGTQLAGIIAAVANGDGINGIAPNAKILPVRVVDDAGSSSATDVLRGVRYAGEIGADVALIDWTTGAMNNTDTSDSTLRGQFESAFNAAPNTLFVAIAGDSTSTLSNTATVYPCDVPSANLVCVTAKGLASANKSSSIVDIVATGTNLLGTNISNGYSTKTGSVAAAAQVAGVAALANSMEDEATGEQLLAWLYRNLPTSPNYASLAVNGRYLDAYAVVSDDPYLAPTKPAPYWISPPAITLPTNGHIVKSCMSTSDVYATCLSNLGLPREDRTTWKPTGATYSYTYAGKELTVAGGSWGGGSGELEVAYQWERCLPTQCFAIDGANDDTYITTDDDVGFTLRVEGFLTDDRDLIATTYTAVTRQIIARPQNDRQATNPTIDHRFAGWMIDADPGTWWGGGTQTNGYAWFRCTADNNTTCGSTAIDSDQQHTFGAGAIDDFFFVRVTASNGAGATWRSERAVRGDTASSNRIYQILKPGAPVFSDAPNVATTVTENGVTHNLFVGNYAKVTDNSNIKRLTGMPGFTYSRIWQRDNGCNGGWNNLSATGTSRLVIREDTGDCLRYFVKVTDYFGRVDTIASNSTAKIYGKPWATADPTLTAGNNPGNTISINSGSWGGPVTWFSWDFRYGDGTIIRAESATSDSYKLTRDDIGRYVKGCVHAHNPAGNSVNCTASRLVKKTG